MHDVEDDVCDLRHGDFVTAHVQRPGESPVQLTGQVYRDDEGQVLLAGHDQQMYLRQFASGRLRIHRWLVEVEVVRHAAGQASDELAGGA